MNRQLQNSLTNFRDSWRYKNDLHTHNYSKRGPVCVFLRASVFTHPQRLPLVHMQLLTQYPYTPLSSTHSLASQNTLMYSTNTLSHILSRILSHTVSYILSHAQYTHSLSCVQNAHCMYPTRVWERESVC